MTNHGPEAESIIPEDVISEVKPQTERGSLRFFKRVLVGVAIGTVALPIAFYGVGLVVMAATSGMSLSELVPWIKNTVVQYGATGALCGGVIGVMDLE